jgi:uncharacterized protein YdiU (UPF0061 family)
MNHQLDALKFDNRFVTELPCDPDSSNRRRQVAGACYSKVLPTKVCKPQLISYSKEVAQLFDLSDEDCTSDYFPQVFAGNQQVPGMNPYAMCYGGHQFGQWAGQLGDGRAINLGEVINKKGERWALQLKGAGPTPYSRTADGLAVLRSSVREFLCSEAMHHLGVPTTRALSLVLTGEKVMRDMFYDGNPMHEPGAVVCRVAPSFTRFGNFEILASRGDVELLRKLVHYTIKNDYPQLGEPSPEVYLTWLTEVCRRTAIMMVHWQRVGFVHGVMNTDNMSIHGLTIDYGPYGWIDNYDPDWTPNTTDAEGRRYCFGNQPQIAQWNLVQLANALYPLLDATEPLQRGLDAYLEVLTRESSNMHASKLGLLPTEAVEAIWQDLESWLPAADIDMTIFFRQLPSAAIGIVPDAIDAKCVLSWIGHALYDANALSDATMSRMIAWMRSYVASVQSQNRPGQERAAEMNLANPKYVLRNYMAQKAIDAAEQGDLSELQVLLQLLEKPYDEQPEYERYFAKRPEWARNRAGCSMLSCSS